VTRYFVRYKSSGKETTWHGSGTLAEAERMAASLKYLRHVSDIRIDSVEVK
jgi:hypothetical protein